MLFVARGGAWTPANHHHWPDAYKAAARALLLAGSHGHSSGRETGAAGKAGWPSISAGCLEGLSKAATGNLLETGSHSQGSSKERGAARKAARQPASSTRLSALPADVLLRIIQLAAHPMSDWM